MPEPDDPRFEWIQVPEIGNEDQWIRGRCKHLAPIPVRAQPTDELVAHLCPDCDAQLPAEWSPLRESIRVPATPSEPSPFYRSGPEFGPGPVGRPSPFLLEAGERIVPLRHGSAQGSS